MIVEDLPEHSFQDLADFTVLFGVCCSNNMAYQDLVANLFTLFFETIGISGSYSVLLLGS
jgi:hypothetical protein